MIFQCSRLLILLRLSPVCVLLVLQLHACLAVAEERFPIGEAAINAWADVVERRTPLQVPRKVLTPYYGWYANDGKWGSVTPETMADLTGSKEAGSKEAGSKGTRVWDRPLLGYYRSDEPAVLAAHCAWARSAGIDVLLSACFKQLSINLLNEAARAGIQVAPYLEFIQENQNSSSAEPAGEKKYEYFMQVARTLARQAQEVPGAVYTIGDKPVIFAYKRTLGAPANPAFWAEALLRLKAEGLEFIILGDLSPTAAVDKGNEVAEARANAWMRIFDGMHSYHVLSMMLGNPEAETVQQRCENLYEREMKVLNDRRRISCLTVMPGWDNRTINSPGMVVDRREGAIYEGMWKAALKQPGADLVMVTSFNEWMEGGTIEPSFSTGTRYLELTRLYSAQFRGLPKEDRQVGLVWNSEGMKLVIPSGTETFSSELRGYPSPVKEDPAVNLMEVVEKCKGVATLWNEQEKRENAMRIRLSTGSRATSSANNPWYDGKPWNGATGEWYYRYDGVPRVEAVFGCHHLIVFLDGGTRCLANGVAVDLAYPATLKANRKVKEKTVLVPLSLLVGNLQMPLVKMVNREPRRPRPADDTITASATTPVGMKADSKLLEEWHPRLVAKVAALIAAGKSVSLSKDSDMILSEATLTGVTILSHNQSAGMPWRAITPLQKAEMLLSTVEHPDSESYLIAALYFVAAGRPSAAEDCLFKADAMDSQAAAALRKQLQGN
jgi:hypothetical protein